MSKPMPNVSPSLSGRASLLLGQIGFWGASVVTLVAAFAPAARAPRLLPWDKAQHFLAFYVLAFLGAAAFPRARAWGVAVVLLVFGAAIEVSQATPWIARDSDFHDLVADAAGIGFALAPLALAWWRERRVVEPEGETG
jgi:VanZ family protein